MLTLIFDGSPRKDGDCAALIDALRSGLEGDVRVVSAYDGGIGPCLDCRSCWNVKGCALEDGMLEVYSEILACDNVVIASPVHFSELSGPLLSVMSRLQTFWATRFFRGEDVGIRPKKGALLIAGGGDGDADKAISTARTLLHQMNARVVGIAASLKTNVLPAREDEAALLQARRIGKMLS